MTVPVSSRPLMSDVDAQCCEAVERAKNFMREHLGDPITVDDVARTAFFSRFHFTRLFHRLTGMPPGRYLARLRLREAMRLLRTTDKKVIEVTFAVGYSSVGTFSARFSEQVGISPTEYRRQCRMPAIGNVRKIQAA